MLFIKVALLLWGLLLNSCAGQEVISGKTNQSTADQCVEKGVQDLISTLKAAYPKLDAFTSALGSPRLLYQRLWTTDVANALKEYCGLYQQKRLAINRCPDSTGKTITVNGFSLADEVCQKRLDDFEKNLPCIVSSPNTSTACQADCSQYEQSSKAYVSSLSTSQGNAKTDKPADCRYLKCEADCRRPLIEKQCGSEAADLQAAALSATFAGERLVYGLGEEKRSFPQECRELIIIAAADGPSAAANGSAMSSSAAMNGSAASGGGGMGGMADAPAAASGATGAGAAPGVTPSAAGGTGAGSAGSGTGSGASATAKPAGSSAGSNGSVPAGGAGASSGNGTSAGGSSGAAAPSASNSSAPAGNSAGAGNAATTPKSGATAPRVGPVGYYTVVTAVGLIAVTIL